MQTYVMTKLHTLSQFISMTKPYWVKRVSVGSPKLGTTISKPVDIKHNKRCVMALFLSTLSL